jgi:uncharacterized membrane protein YhaH (DUF805 family)
MSLTQLLFSFRGRINRALYWFSTIGMVAVLAALISLRLGDGGIIGRPALILAWGAQIPLIWALLAISMKRLHDRNKSAWWLLFFFLLPTLLELLAKQLRGTVGLVLLLINVVITGWVFIELGLAPGTHGPNDYGPDPLPPTSDKPA